MLIKHKKEMTKAEQMAVANTNNSYLQALSYVAVGTIFPFAGSEAPDTFMICDGSELDVEEYTDLFNVIGYTFGGSDDTFKLPDLRGRVLVGLDSTINEFKSIGSIGGEITHALTETEGPAHAHAASTEKHNGFEYYYQVIADPAASVSTGKFNVEKNSAGKYRIMGANTEATDYLNEKALSTFKTTAEAGKGDAHNNLQPYIVCNYIIKVNNNIPKTINIEYPDINTKIDQNYDPLSENAQSGKAVAQAVENEAMRANTVLANAIKGNLEGEVISANDVSPVEHNVKVNMTNKNLFNKVNEYIKVVPNVTYFLSSAEASAADRIKFRLYDAQKKEIKSNSFNINTFYYSTALGFWQNGSDTTSLYFSFRFTNSEVAYILFTNKYPNMQLEQKASYTPYTPHVADFSVVKVMARGKNLVDITKPDVFPTGGRFEVLDKNTFRTYGCSGFANATVGFRIYAPTGTQLAVTFDYELGGEATGTWFVRHIGTGAGSNIKSGDITPVGEEGYVYFTFARSGGSGNNLLGWVDIKNLQVEVGTTATEYEPYKGAEYTAEADGSVKGVKSISPNMTLTADTDGIIISAEYNKDLNKSFSSVLERLSALETAVANS